MNTHSHPKLLSSERIASYLTYLRQQERSEKTIQKYAHDLTSCAVSLSGCEITRERLIAWKESLIQTHSSSSVNAALAAVNGFLAFFHWHDLKIKPLKIQRQLFCDAERELSRSEYLPLVGAAKTRGNERISLVLQTICSTGIRVSELRFITAEAVRSGRTEVACKGKRRTVFLPEKLRKPLKRYLKKQKRTTGPVFVTKSGRPLDRSNIWRDMKALCGNAGVSPKKVFPHNLRHLFARTFYSIEKDLSRLADILGHTNISTTRIYTMESGTAHVRLLNQMGLILTT